MGKNEVIPSSEIKTETEEITISSWKFVLGCIATAAAVLFVGSFCRIPSTWVAIEVFATVIGLFVFGSFKYRIDKNALTYGMVFVIVATFWSVWWQTSGLRHAFLSEGPMRLLRFFGGNFLTFRGLDRIIHADTMLFILGLTFFVAVIAQTRLLETLSFKILTKNKGRVLPTIAILTFVVSFASGILDGVSMIGLMIRVLILILFLAKIKDEAVIFMVIVSTVITTVCGMWLAYGEPPNLIMKANLHPHLNNAFFIRYCAPAALASYVVVLWNLSRKLKRPVVRMQDLDILDQHNDDVRFLQATKHGRALLAVELIDDYKARMAGKGEAVESRLHRGESLGLALIHEEVPVTLRKEILGEYTSENLADDLDSYYRHAAAKERDLAERFLEKIRRALKTMQGQRLRAQKIGLLAFLPFIGLLILHAVEHEVPLFLSSFAAFFVAVLGIRKKVRRLALQEGKHEYQEYLFLLPLFLSITLLQKTGFFSDLSAMLQSGIDRLGVAWVAYLQYCGAAFLSAILDNNVVADFASHALHGFEISILHLFAMAQIAGYAVGGCWTHIGCAQSVVAYAFIRREIRPNYTPLNWMKSITPIMIQLFVVMGVLIWAESLLLKYLG